MKIIPPERIDLGLTLLSRRAIPGVPLQLEDIAAWAGCGRSTISMIEARAIHKLRKAIFLRRDPLLIELLRSIIPKA